MIVIGWEEYVDGEIASFWDKILYYDYILGRRKY